MFERKIQINKVTYMTMIEYCPHLFCVIYFLQQGGGQLYDLVFL